MMDDNIKALPLFSEQKSTIIVSLTTISSRLRHIHLVIESLLAQDFQSGTFVIRLNLSKEAYLLDDGCSELTRELLLLSKNNNDRFFIDYEENTGPYRKLIPVLNEVYKKAHADFVNTLIVTADDDTYYPSWWLQKLYNYYQKHQCIVGFRGRSMVFKNQQPISYKKWSKNITENPSLLNVATGKDGILYSPLHLHPNVRNINAAIQYAAKADDLWIKAHSLLANIPSFIIHTTLEEEFPSVTGKEPEKSLYRSFNERGGNDDALFSIEQYLLLSKGISLYQLCTDTKVLKQYMSNDISTHVKLI
jgi:hypothetical protein